MMKKVLVTGGTGYIGSWVVKYLLEEGHLVRVTVRDKNKKHKVQHLLDIAEQSEGKLEFWEADLLKQGSFTEAMEGCELVYHLASPFVIMNIKDPYKQLINPAVEGTKNVLKSVNQTPSVKRVILTSSVVSIYGDNADLTEQNIEVLDESYWNTSSSDKHQPYSYSKVMAEKEAWKIHDAQDQWKLSVINPAFVMGPFLTNSSDSASLPFLKDYLSGKLKMGVPNFTFIFVDVRDVAKAHLLAAEKESDGRHLIGNETLTMLEFSNLIAKSSNKPYKLPKKELPKFMLLMLGWAFGISRKMIQRNVNYPVRFTNKKSIENLGLNYTSSEQMMKDHLQQIEN